MSEQAKIKTRKAIARQNKYRISVVRTLDHFAATLHNPEGIAVCGTCTRSKVMRKKLKKTGNCDAAEALGMHLGELISKEYGELDIAFDRSGYLYHGRVAAFVGGLRKFLKI